MESSVSGQQCDSQEEFPAGAEYTGAPAKQRKLLRMQVAPPAPDVVLTPSAIPDWTALLSAGL